MDMEQELTGRHHMDGYSDGVQWAQGEPVAFLWQHKETGRTRVAMLDQIINADANWHLVGPLVLADHKAAPPDGWNPAPADKMTARRAEFFMERLKREEKLLGPNERAAVDFVLAMLDDAQIYPEAAQGEPVATLHADGYWTHPAGRDPLDQFSGKVRLDVYAAAPKAAPPTPRVPALPFAVFDEFGNGADDRVQDYAARLVAAERAAPKAAPTTCEWRLTDLDAGIWSAACDPAVAYTFTEGGPTENGHKHCHACGKPLGVVRAREAADRIEADAEQLRRISALEAERDALRAEADSFQMAYRIKCDEETKAQAEEISKLRAEVETLRADAERWRFVNASDTIAVCDVSTDGDWRPIHTQAVNDTIDRARSAAAIGKGE